MRKFIFTITALSCGFVQAQDSLKIIHLEEIAVYSTRANEKTPTTYSTLSKKEIDSRNLGQDLPILLNFSPSVVTTSDAGAGVGYTGMRIRGSDASRINVTINGIPLNDPESHGVFWVNTPDFTSSLNSIQIQRGVGSSSNGSGAFGGTVNLQTNRVSKESYVETAHTFGSFNTWKSNIVYNSGLIDQLYNFEARLSKITSDGYVDRSAAELKSYYLSGGRFGKKTMVKMILFGGQEMTQQAWYGTPEARLTGNEDDLQALQDFGGEYGSQEQIDNLINSDRRFNYYLYDNEIDNYRQDQYQLHIGHTFSDDWNFSGALHFTRGRGYFEQFRADDDLADYGFDDVVVGTETISSSDIIRRRWLDNYFYGTTFSLNYDRNNLAMTIGGAANSYDGDHFGEVVWMQFAGDANIRDRYYAGNGTKKDFNSFAKVNYQVSDKINVYGDAQVRNIAYQTAGLDSDRNPYDVDETYTFFNPKLGVTFSFKENMDVYASFAIANREPVRDDLINNEDAKPENLSDVEVGVRGGNEQFMFQANYYYMNYQDQLVVTGAVNDVGEPIRINVPDSYRMGLELDGSVALSERITWSGNLALSQNRIKEFLEEGEIQHTDTDISFSPNVVAGNRLSFTSGIFSAELLTKYVGQQFLDNTSNDDRAIDAYLTNDVRLSVNLPAGEIKNLGLTLMVNNILNEEYSSNGYTWGYFYGPTDRYQQNNYYPQAGRNFLMGLSLRF